MNVFDLKIVASNKIFFDGKAQQIILPVADMGTEGFLANHENTVAPIEFGEMKITTEDGNEIFAFVGNGFLEFFDNSAMLVCISAELPHEIDERRAREAKERAEGELQLQRSQLEYFHSQANLSRAMERLKVKNRHNI